MTPEVRAIYEKKLKRLNDSIALKETDSVPLPLCQFMFPYYNSPYSIADYVYDTDLSLTRKAVLNYAAEYDTDKLAGLMNSCNGEGRILEIMQPKDLMWAGMPGDRIQKDSVHQHIEFPILEEDEFDEWFQDQTGWIFRKGLPRITPVFEGLSKIDVRTEPRNYYRTILQLSTPEVKESMQKIWEVAELVKAKNAALKSIAKETEETYGLPATLDCGMIRLPFDLYSDHLRGTMLSFTDIYAYPEEFDRFLAETLEVTLHNIAKMKGVNDGGRVNMMLHKGFDGLISDELFRTKYWPGLQKIICAIVDANKVPVIFCEGGYNSRLDYLTDVPTGKVLYRFEKIDYAEAKKKLGGHACFTGGFPNFLLNYGTPQQVEDEVKRLLDICAPGGGYQFDTDGGLCNAKKENMDMLVKTVREYGKSGSSL